MDIKELRSSQGLSQSEIAKKLEVTPGTIGHLENGRMKVSDKLAVKVSARRSHSMSSYNVTLKKYAALDLLYENYKEV